jgi:segregation and condensation protein A
MATADDYKVDLDVFEGPLDLLLYLIKREEVDIYNIPIEKITKQYMEYLGLMRMLDLNIAGEFIVMAATLMMIKSRMLLPVEVRPEAEEEEDDPRWDLVRQLLEYKKFKDVALRLQDREFLQESIFPSGGAIVAVDKDEAGVVLQDVSLFDLISAFREMLGRAKPEEFGEIEGHRYTVEDQIVRILHTVRAGRSVRFAELFTADASRYEIICTFLGLLELIRMRQVAVTQEERFGDILVLGLAESEPAAAMPEEMENAESVASEP